MWKLFKDKEQPLNQVKVTRLLVALLVVSSLIAGYYSALYTNEERKYDRVEDMFVRVRNELGREETQRLIDLSHQKDSSNTLEDW